MFTFGLLYDLMSNALSIRAKHKTMETKTMNKLTYKAYEFFLHDKEAQEAAKKIVNDCRSRHTMGSQLEEYMAQLNPFELMAVYHQIKATVIEATDWVAIADLLIADKWNVDPCCNAINDDLDC